MSKINLLHNQSSQDKTCSSIELPLAAIFMFCLLAMVMIPVFTNA